MTFVSELVEPWEPNRVAVLFSLVLGGTPVVASSRPWLFPAISGDRSSRGQFPGRRSGLPPFLILPSTCGLLFPGVSMGREGQLTWTVDAADLWSPKRKTQKNE